MQSFSRQRFFVRPLFAAFALTLITPATMPLAARADDAGFPLVNGGSARVSFADGRVTIGRGRSGDGFAAGIDSPVLDSDYVSTGAQSHAEIRFDGTALVRLGENVQLRVARLDADGRDVQLAAGTIEVRLLRGIDGQTAIDTPSVSVIPDDTGSYRITVDDQGTTFVTVRSGHAEIQTPHGDRPLTPGTTLVAEGTASDPKISSRDEGAMDGFDAFNQDRDQQRTAGIEPPPISAPSPTVIPGKMVHPPPMETLSLMVAPFTSPPDLRMG